VADSGFSQSAGEQWRFIDSGKTDGAMNMALDMAMTKAASAGDALPTLRVYGWTPAAISLGYHQSEKDIDLERCRKDNIDVVLRPTGGRAILHDNELTYAVSIPPNSRFFAPDIHSVYALISRSLVAALRRLDVDVEFDRAGKTPKDFSKGDLSTLCYASSVKYEINIGRKKLVGSAQRRINGGVLQHGSILIGDEHLRITRYLAAKDERRRERLHKFMRENTISLNQVSEQAVAYSQIAAAMKLGFEEELGINFVKGDFSKTELEDAARLEPKFAIYTSPE